MSATCPVPVPVRLLRRAALAVVLLALCASAALASPAAARAQLLKRGSRGVAVVHLQRRLAIPADGVFGAQTLRAVRRYQRRRHLAVDGIVGPRTAAALGIRLAQAARAARGDGGGTTVPTVLQRIARCESGGNPRAISPGGAYRGKYQFDRQTWQAIGGHGDPARAPEGEQDRRALGLLRARGTAPWPSCA